MAQNYAVQADEVQNSARVSGVSQNQNFNPQNSNSALKMKKTKKKTRKWAKLVKYSSYILLFYSVFDGAKVLYDFLTKPHIDFTVDHEFDDNASTVRVTKQHLMMYWLMKIVSDVLIFAQGYYCL